MEQILVTVTGRVQGVSYRAWARDEARRLNLSGWVRNRADGSVEALLAGPSDAVETMTARMRTGPAAARVQTLRTREWPDDHAPAPFEIRR